MENAKLVDDPQRLSESIGQLPEPAANPVLIAVSGLPGTGKTYLCSKLAERLPVILLESDALRKTLFPVPGYSATESKRLFKTIYLLMEKFLAKGFSQILDATNLTEKHREYLYSIVDRYHAKLIMVNVYSPPETVKQRLEKRAEEKGNNSDADWSVYNKMKLSAERIGRNHLLVDTSIDISPALEKIVREAQN